jgi:hypothetical protein
VKANELLDEIIALADEKGAFFWKATARASRGCLLALTGDAPKASSNHVGNYRISVYGSDSYASDFLFMFGLGLCRTRPVR